jgi:P22 coat protein - gene protein 5
MANALKVQSIIAKESLALLDNNLSGLINSFHRDTESEFNKSINGYKVGDTISMRRPADFTVRSGAVRSAQDIVEGQVQVVVDQQIGVDFDLTSKELTLTMEDRGGVNGLRERVIKPAVTNLVNSLVYDCMTQFYRSVYNYVGTPGTRVTSYAGFSKAPERLDEMAVPSDSRFAALNPSDNWGMLGSQTALYIQDAAKGAYRSGSLGMIGDVDTYSSGVLPTHTVGAHAGTPLVNGASQNVTYATAKDSWTQSLVTDGWSNSITGILKAGDVFTIANVYAVNPKTRATLNFLQQFVVTADANSGASTGPATLTISPPIIVSGPHQTVNAAPADNAAITVLGTASTNYRQNLVYHKNAFSLAVVPMVIPPGSVDFARESMKGLSIRVGPVYDGTNDVSGWRMDMLYGRKTIDPRIATRLGGT